MGLEYRQRKAAPRTALRGRSGVAAACVALLVLSSCTDSRPVVIKRVQSWQNLKEIGLALNKYHENVGSFPPVATYDPDGQPLLSWRVLILPYIDQEGVNELYEQFHLDEPWDSAHNRPLAEKMPHVYSYLSDGSSGANTTNYLAVIGEATAFPPRRMVTMSEITDGLETTILAIEVCPSTVVWTKPEDLVFGESFPMPAKLGTPYRGPRDVGSRHALFANGEVLTIWDEIDPEVWRALMTIQGGEPVQRTAISAFEFARP